MPCGAVHVCRLCYLKAESATLNSDRCHLHLYFYIISSYLFCHNFTLLPRDNKSALKQNNFLILDFLKIFFLMVAITDLCFRTCHLILQG